MNIDKYEVLLKILELGSLSKAAETLGYTQSNITHMLKGLEEEFCFQIITRTKKGVKLTPNGERVINQIQKVVMENNKLLSIVSSINNYNFGTIRIGAFTSIATHYLLYVIRDFQKDYPNVEITLADGAYGDIENWMLEGKIDIGFLAEAKELKIEFYPLVKDEMKAIISSKHKLVNAKNYPISEFANEKFIYPHTGFDLAVNSILKKANIKPNIKFNIQGDEAMIAMVNHGFGVTILPNLYIQDKDVIAKSIEPRQYRTLGYSINPMISNKLVDIFVTYVKRYME